MITVADHTCPHCGNEMQLDKQEQRAGQTDLNIVTCKNKACEMWSVTLTIDIYNSLTPDQIAGYKTMVSNLKKTFGYT